MGLGGGLGVCEGGQGAAPTGQQHGVDLIARVHDGSPHHLGGCHRSTVV